MCGAEDCCAGPEHARECGVLARGGVAPVLGSVASPAWLYSAVAILRLLLLKRADLARWRQVEQLMDHWEERARDPATVAALDIIHALLTRHQGCPVDFIPTDGSHRNSYYSKTMINKDGK